jgi:hypothetical protein
VLIGRIEEANLTNARVEGFELFVMDAQLRVDLGQLVVECRDGTPGWKILRLEQ